MGNENQTGFPLKSGTCGENATWIYIEETACLSIQGKGRMEDWQEGQERPWQAWTEKIRCVKAEQGVTSIGDCAFMGCTGLKEIELAETVEMLGVYSFRDCTALEMVSLPEGVRVICAKAFWGCTALRQIELPETLTNIDMRAFAKDEALHKVFYHGSPRQWKQILISVAASENRFLLAAELQCGREDKPGEEIQTANRYGEIVGQVRDVLKKGGDGNLYLLTPRLTQMGIRAKCGDCTLIVFPNGQTMMIDAGYVACCNHIIHLLKDLELNHLDYFVLSHAHDDHAGGALAVAQYLYEAGGGIDFYYRTAYIKASKMEPPFLEYLKEKNTRIFTEVLEGYQWKIGEVEIAAYNPTQEMLEACDGTDAGVNDVSIVMHFTYGNSSYLTSGDLYRKAEEALAAKYGKRLQADVMKSNHHGTYTSNGATWVETVSPKIIVTDADDVGSTLFAEEVTAKGIAYYSSGIQGLVCVKMDKNHAEVLSQYDYSWGRN